MVIGSCEEFPLSTGKKKRACVATGPQLDIRKNFLTVNVKSSGLQYQREASGMCLSQEYVSALSRKLFGWFSVDLWMDGMGFSESTGLVLPKGMPRTVAFTGSMPTADSQLRGHGVFPPGRNN